MGYDLAIIGSGAAAFAAAIAATGQGRRVVMVERGTVGGTCVNTGCVPSKALLAAAEARYVSLDGRFPGIAVAPFGVDLAALVAGKRELVESLRADKYVDLAADYGWEILGGSAAFVEGPALRVTLNDGGTVAVTAEHFLIATGSAPAVPPIAGLAEAGFLTSTTAMELEELPESMIVIGGNAVGLEQAQLFSRIGVQVFVVEALDRLAPWEEPEIGATLAEVFTREGIGVLTGAIVTSVRRDPDGCYRVVLAGGNLRRPCELTGEQLLMATGRRPVTDGLGLGRVGVQTGPGGEVVVDEYLRTDNERIWAAGDVTGGPQFVYVAAAHGTLVADNALSGAERTLDYTALPRVTFTSPAIAAVGLTEAQAVEAGIPCECRTLPLGSVPRALVNRVTGGLVKLVADAEDGRLLGVHVLAENAGDIITAATYALTAGFTVDQLAHTWSPYLTMAESLRLAAQTFTTDVTKLSCCAG